MMITHNFEEARQNFIAPAKPQNLDVSGIKNIQKLNA